MHSCQTAQVKTAVTPTTMNHHETFLNHPMLLLLALGRVGVASPVFKDWQICPPSSFGPEPVGPVGRDASANAQPSNLGQHHLQPHILPGL